MSDHFSIPNHFESTNLPAVKRFSSEDILQEKECIVILYVSWSPALVESQHSLQFLHEKKYSHPVYLINQDTMSVNEQLSLLGELGHGWGETFIFRQGIIVQKFTGKTGPFDFRKFIG